MDDPSAGHPLEVVHFNELKGGTAASAHRLGFDNVQGHWRADIAAWGEHTMAADIPWGELGVDLAPMA